MSTDKLDRRDFLKHSALVSAAVALGGTPGALATGRKPVLASVSGPGVPKDLAAAVAKVLEPLGGMRAFVKEGQTVMLKPNLSVPVPPEQRATTSPAFVAAVAREVLALNPAKLLIVDFPVRDPKKCIKTQGIREAVAGLDVKIVLPVSRNDFVEKAIPDGKALTKTRIAREALEIDVHIALPLAKSHMATGFSGVLKGMMGLIWDRQCFHSVHEMNQAVCDLNTVLKAHLAIMDGLEIMSNGGPVGPGDLVRCNALIAGTDPVAVDAAGVRLAPLYGRAIKPRQLTHLRIAEKMGLGKLIPAKDSHVALTL